MISKSYIFILSLLFSFNVFAQQTHEKQAKCSPQTLQYLHNIETLKGKPYVSHEYVYKSISGKLYLSAMVKVEGMSYKKAFSDLGILTGTTAGNILTIQIPMENLSTLLSSECIQYLQLDEPVFMTMDSARADTRVDSVHQGINLPQAYSGKNVVVGIIDAGFDYSHPTLLDTSGTRYRLKKVWEQKTTGNPPTGYTYGNEISDSASLYNDGSDVALFSHGTHVAGIAAGSGVGSPANKYQGVAFESDLVFVGIKPDQNQWTTTGMSNIIDGINYIYNYAASVGKPAVVNLSWGCSMGPHDGTSLFSQALDQLTGAGKIFVCAAGNNGADNIHLNKKFTATDTLIRSYVVFPTVDGLKKTWIDMWGEAGKTYCVKVSLFNGTTMGNSTGFICPDSSLFNYNLIGPAGDTCFLSLTNTAIDFNGKPRIFCDLFSKTASKVEISFKCSDGSMNAWMGYVKDYTGYYGGFSVGIVGQTVGNKDMTVGDMASSHTAIAAAAYASKISYTNVDGGNVSYSSYVAEGNLAPFSSHGPGADSTAKPNIASPGLILASGINSYDTTYNTGGANRSEVVSNYTSPVNGRNYSYAMMMGTSMASPMTTGIIALMLEANPALNPNLTMGILKETAITDNFTGVIPSQGSYLWGYGKINAYGAVKKTWESVNVNKYYGSESLCMLYPNPNQGQFSIDLNSERSDIANIIVYDISGKCVYQTPWTLSCGMNNKSFNLNVSKGIYFAKVATSDKFNYYKLVVE
ncbi:MAG: S8/S53 family peptidase [Bacteroidota bacterium]